MNAGGRCGNGRVGAAGERSGPGIDERRRNRAARKFRRADRSARCFLFELVEEDGAGAASSAPAEKPMMPILFGIDVPFLGVGAHEADGLEGVVDGVGLRVVAVRAEAVAEDDGVDAVVVEVRNKVGAFSADVQRVVPAAGGEDDGGAGVDAAIHRMHLDRRIVDVDDAVDPARHGLAHVVLFGFADAGLG